MKTFRQILIGFLLSLLILQNLAFANSTSPNYNLYGGQTSSLSNTSTSNNFLLNSLGSGIGGRILNDKYNINLSQAQITKPQNNTPTTEETRRTGSFLIFDRVAPKLKNLQVLGLKARSAQVFIESDESADVEFSYGRTQDIPTTISFQNRYEKENILFLDKLFPNTTYLYSFSLKDNSNNISEKFQGEFKTLPSMSTIPNVSNFRINFKKNTAFLNWNNPLFTNFQEIVLIRKFGSLPRNDQDGEVLLRGNEEFFIDTTLKKEGVYYYTIFVYSQEGHRSAGSITKLTFKKETLISNESSKKEQEKEQEIKKVENLQKTVEDTLKNIDSLENKEKLSTNNKNLLEKTNQILKNLQQSTKNLLEQIQNNLLEKSEQERRKMQAELDQVAKKLTDLKNNLSEQAKNLGAQELKKQLEAEENLKNSLADFFKFSEEIKTNLEQELQKNRDRILKEEKARLKSMTEIKKQLEENLTRIIRFRQILLQTNFEINFENSQKILALNRLLDQMQKNAENSLKNLDSSLKNISSQEILIMQNKIERFYREFIEFLENFSDTKKISEEEFKKFFTTVAKIKNGLALELEVFNKQLSAIKQGLKDQIYTLGENFELLRLLNQNVPEFIGIDLSGLTNELSPVSEAFKMPSSIVQIFSVVNQNGQIVTLPLTKENPANPTQSNWELIANEKALISIPLDHFRKEITTIIVTMATEAYILEYNPTNRAYEALITAPAKKGDYKMIVQVIYQDNTYDEINVSILVDPYGIVYTRKIISLFRSEPVTNATVTLYAKNRFNRWIPWPAHLYNQKNPQTTDSSGKFIFFTPPGNYYLEVKHPNYLIYKTFNFNVKDKILNINIFLNFYQLVLTLFLLLSVIILTISFLFKIGFYSNVFKKK